MPTCDTNNQNNYVNFAKNKKGTFLGELSNEGLVIFECDLNHKFYLSSKQISQDQWCNTCVKMFINISKYAEEK